MEKGKRVTLTDIAKVVGVTPATVQRALRGLEGVGEEQRKRILKVAKEMNYRPNVLASTLKRGELNIAVVLPNAENENQYYAASLWEGVQAALDESYGYMVKGHRFPYERSPENLGKAMEQMCGELGGQVDGVITMGVADPAFLEVCKGLNERRIPYVFVGTDCREAERLCCVTACNEIAGKMAADMFLNFHPEQKGKIILTGDFSIEDQRQNALGFEKQMGQYGRDFRIIKLINYNGIQATGEEISRLLSVDGEVVGIYSTSARNTLAVSMATQDFGKRLLTIGSDVFPENIELLKARRISAIIHKRSFDQAYRVAQILMDYLLTRRETFHKLEQVLPQVVTNGNIACFKGTSVIGGYIL